MLSDACAVNFPALQLIAFRMATVHRRDVDTCALPFDRAYGCRSRRLPLHFTILARRIRGLQNLRILHPIAADSQLISNDVGYVKTHLPCRPPEPALTSQEPVEAAVARRWCMNRSQPAKIPTHGPVIALRRTTQACHPESSG
jgi:hypothetical protein